jgi:hypothetical protein
MSHIGLLVYAFVEHTHGCGGCPIPFDAGHPGRLGARVVLAVTVPLLAHLLVPGCPSAVSSQPM